MLVAIAGDTYSTNSAEYKLISSQKIGQHANCCLVYVLMMRQFHDMSGQFFWQNISQYNLQNFLLSSLSVKKSKLRKMVC